VVKQVLACQNCPRQGAFFILCNEVTDEVFEASNFLHIGSGVGWVQ
jgi:hypothetical protein